MTLDIYGRCLVKNLDYLCGYGRYWMFLEGVLVPGAGIEPAQPQWPRDFKSLVSTSFTIRATPYSNRLRCGTCVLDGPSG